jgi:16S rRNA (uracil1498-N3)-methyltransferase
MPQIRLFVSSPLLPHGAVILSKDQAHYLLHVMRAKTGEKLAVFNGKDGEWEAEISFLSKKEVSLTALSQTKVQTSEPDIWLAFAPVKNAAIHFVAQKATELGVSALLPVFTDHTIINRVSTDKLLANAIEAAEQSERLTVPEIHEAQKLTAFLSTFPQDRTLVFCDESGQGAPIISALKNHRSPKLALLIGPEGGFSTKELDILHKHPHVIAVGLGPRILRADTAALAGLACLQAVCGDWDQAPRFVPSA